MRIRNDRFRQMATTVGNAHDIALAMPHYTNAML